MADCIFCLHEAVATSEHVIPREISNRIREVSPLTPEHGAPVQPKPGSTSFRTNKLIDLKLKAVCPQCNQGFFNELQAAAAPFFLPAIGGQRVDLSTELKKAVAAWAYKTALLVPFTAAPRRDWPAISGSLCSDFYRSARPPVGARVWAGQYDLRSDYPELVARADVSELNVIRRGVQYRGTHVLLTLGFLLVAVMFWPRGVPDQIPHEGDRFPQSKFVGVWPAVVGETTWPPDHMFDYQELAMLSTWGP